MNDVKKLVIDRSKWCRAVDQDPLGSSLVRSDGKMCCLGFYGCALGADPKTPMSNEGDGVTNGINGNAYPSMFQAFWPKWLFENQPGKVESALGWLIEVNDETGDEQEIARIFAEHGVEVEFVDGEPEEKQP